MTTSHRLKLVLPYVLVLLAPAVFAAPPQTANSVGAAMAKAPRPTYTQPNSNYATNSGYAASAGSANTANSASYATSSGAAKTASTAGYANSAGSSNTSNSANYATTAGSANTAGSASSCTGTATQCGVPVAVQNAANIYSVVFTLSNSSWPNIGYVWENQCSPGCGQWMTSSNPGTWDDNKGNWSQEWSFRTSVPLNNCTATPWIAGPQWTNMSVYKTGTYTWEVLEYWTSNSSGYYNAAVQVVCSN